MAKTIDPTRNVISLSRALAREQKNALKAEARRQDDLRAAESHRIDQQIIIRADAGRMLFDTHRLYEAKLIEAQEKLTNAEKSRVDALLLANAAEQRSANQRAIETATGLATQVATTAETMRTSVESTRNALSAKQAEFEERITKRMTDVENFQQQDVGKSKVVDPIQTAFMENVGTSLRKLESSVNTNSGKSEGINLSWTVLVAIILIVIAFGTMMYTRSPAPQQVNYAPAPQSK